MLAVDMEALLKSLQSNKDIVKLDLSNNLIDDRGVINVCQTVVSLERLKSLNISGNLLTADGIMKIENQFSVARQHLGELTELDLSFNKITDGGVKSVGRICEILPKLNVLCLRSCHLTTMHSLSNTAFDRLVELDLSHNRFKNLSSLWSVLELDQIKVLNLNLSIASFYTKFAREFVDFLKAQRNSNIALESLSLANCNFTDSLIWELVHALKPSCNLTKLDLMYNSQLTFLSAKTILQSGLPLNSLNLRGCHQVAIDLKADELYDVNNLPRSIVLSLSKVDDKTALAESMKSLWISKYGLDPVEIEQTNNTLKITYSQ